MTIMFETMNHEEIKSYILDSLSSVNERLFPYNTYIAHLLARKKNQELKNFASLDSSSVYASTYDSLLSSLSSEDINFASQYYSETTSMFDQSHLVYFYYGSSSNVFFNIFPSVLPSDFNNLYTYMIANNLLKKIGTNLGKAHLFSSQIAYHDFSSFIDNQTFVNYSDAVDAMILEMSNLKKDRQHLLMLLDQKDQHISSLHQDIADLNHKNYISSTFTWS
jgi:hypothetical protein